MKRTHTHRERGYNLVEVLIAMALLGTVLMSIITLFYMGRRNVYSGKQQTKITAVGTRVMEDINNMTPDDVLANFNITNATTLGSPCVTINSVAYSGCVARSTATFVTADDPGGFLQRWKDLLGTGSSLFSSPVIIVIVTPAGDVGCLPTACDNIRVRTILQWREGTRVRYSIYDASKLNRPDDNQTE